MQAADARAMKAGEAIYFDTCTGATRTGGVGQPGFFPPLKGMAGLQSPDPTNTVRVILQGARTAPTPTHPTPLSMPSFAWKLNDEQMADVATYVRNAWGNSAARRHAEPGGQAAPGAALAGPAGAALSGMALAEDLSNDQVAEAVGLVYVDDSEPGITRRKVGKGWGYTLPNGKPLRDEGEIERIAKLAIPPAYTDVWISPDPRGHIQATGRDDRGRKQYRYHAVGRPPATRPSSPAWPPSAGR